jgi:hypothetical protein
MAWMKLHAWRSYCLALKLGLGQGGAWWHTLVCKYNLILTQKFTHNLNFFFASFVFMIGAYKFQYKIFSLAWLDYIFPFKILD